MSTKLYVIMKNHVYLELPNSWKSSSNVLDHWHLKLKDTRYKYVAEL